MYMSQYITIKAIVFVFFFYKTVVRLFYLHNGNSYTDKTAYLYSIKPLQYLALDLASWL